MNKDKNKVVGYYIGTVLSTILLACIAVCIGGTAIALTTKLLLWLF